MSIVLLLLIFIAGVYSQPVSLETQCSRPDCSVQCTLLDVEEGCVWLDPPLNTTLLCKDIICSEEECTIERTLTIVKRWTTTFIQEEECPTTTTTTTTTTTMTPTTPPPLLGETAYGFLDPDSSTCFHSENWGWYTELSTIVSETYTFNLYAGAGRDCKNRNDNNIVGTVDIIVDATEQTISFYYNVANGVGDVHTLITDDFDDVMNLSPGHYTYVGEVVVEDIDFSSFNVSQTLWIVLHAGV